MKQDLDISNVEGKPKRDRIRIERKKYDELVAEFERLKFDNDQTLKALQHYVGVYKKLLAENEATQSELNRLRNDNNDLAERETHSSTQWHKSSELIKSKATEHAHLDTLARTLRDQRDMARFIAALLLIASVGFTIAVLTGRLVPVY